MAEPTMKSEKDWLSYEPAARLNYYQKVALTALVAPKSLNEYQIGGLAYGLFRDPQVSREQILPDTNGDVSSYLSQVPADGTTFLRTMTAVSGGASPKFWDSTLFVAGAALAVGGAIAAGGGAGVASAAAGGAARVTLGVARPLGGLALKGLKGLVNTDTLIGRAFPLLTSAVTGYGVGATAGSFAIEGMIGADARAAIDAAVQPEGPVNPTLGIPDSDQPRQPGDIIGNQPGTTGSTAYADAFGSEDAAGDWDRPPPWPSDDWNFYGVPEGYVATTLVPNPAYNPNLRSVARARHRLPPKEILGPVPPTFGGEDAWLAINQLWAANQLEGFQRMMEKAGLLDEGKYLPGVSDPETINAMISVMAVANNQGITEWPEAAELVLQSGLQNLEETRDTLQAPLFVNRTYVAPDYDSLSQGIKGLFRDRLGRDPLDYEISLFADQLQKDYRSEFDALEQARYDEFVAGNRDWNTPTEDPAASMFDIPVGTFNVPDDPRYVVNADNVRTAGGGTVQGVDPAASFAEAFEKRYAQEITNLDTKATNQRAQERAINMLSNIRSRLGSL